MSKSPLMNYTMYNPLQ
jgi:hypothetical protein